MKALIAQINTTPCDFEGNTAKIKEGIKKGFEQKADLVIFPELSIPGYLCRDKVYEHGFVTENLKRVREITAFYDVCSYEHPNHLPHVVFGYIDANRTGVGKPFRNMAAVLHNGTIIARYAKHLLPFYDVFDEGRYFEPGKELAVIEVRGQRWGICICEDVWNDKDQDDYSYRCNPIQQYREIGVKNIISLNSSPFVQGKIEKRIKMLCAATENGGQAFYVNQFGGQDELMFDGHSFHVQNGRLTYLLKESMATGNDAYGLMDSDNEDNQAVSYMYFHDHSDEILYNALKWCFRDYVRKSGFTNVVLGSSGGIDSAVVAALACDALGPENVHGVRMPSVYSSEGSKDDALSLHKNLGCHDYIVPIEHISLVAGIVEAVEKSNPDLKNQPYNKVADENIQARLRGMSVMHLSNAYGMLPVTTGNKTELALGYCTLYGDMNGGYAPINDLYKLEVYRIARYINTKAGKEIIPVNIIDKAPSAELAPGQTDEASLLPYAILDPIVRAYVEDYVGTFAEFRDWAGRNGMAAVMTLGNKGWEEKSGLLNPEWFTKPEAQEKYKKMIRLININEFKRRQAAPGIKVSKVAFGSGRRLPIVKRF